MEKPSLPSGTRDFSPSVMQRRKYILSVMERVFVSHGFGALETPSLENLRTLQGKYGNEGDQLLFKVLNSGDFLSKADASLLSSKDRPHTSDIRSRIKVRFNGSFGSLCGDESQRNCVSI